MESVISAKVKKAVELFDGFDLHNRDDQIDLMAAVTFLRLKDPERVKPLMGVGVQLYITYFNARLEKLSVKPEDNSEYANCLRKSFAEQDIRQANQVLTDMLRPPKPTWDQLTANPIMFSLWLNS
jgi:hypothetical protein